MKSSEHTEISKIVHKFSKSTRQNTICLRQDCTKYGYDNHGNASTESRNLKKHKGRNPEEEPCKCKTARNG